MNKIKILGIGSPFGDDEAGWKIVNLLKQSMRLQRYIPEYLWLENHDRPGVRLLQLMADANTILLVDAVMAGNPLGTIYRYANDEIDEFKCLISTHDMGVIQVLQLGSALKQLPENLIFYGIEIKDTSLHASVSMPMTSATQQAAERIEDEIYYLLNK